jgi:hypothetical protein
MRCGRVHPLRVQVEWMPLTAPVSPAAFGTFQVRPVVPGCQVVPGELSLDPSNPVPGTFHLTPLATGRLPHARLELVRGGLRLPDCPLPLRSVTPTLVRRLALLAVLVPTLFLYLACYAGLTTPAGSAPVSGPVAAALQHHLPPLGSVTAEIAVAVQRTFDAFAAAEGSVRMGFLLALMLTAGTVLAAVADRSTRRTLLSQPIALGAASPPPSSRLRMPPPYLTPVSPDELSHFQR